MDKMKLNLPLTCDSCKARNNSSNDFSKLISLTNSGLTIYISKSGKTESNKQGSVILHNVGDRVLKKPDFITELYHRRTKCGYCNILIQRVYNLINEISEIKENEAIGVCDHCKRSATVNKCKKCDDIVKKFLNNQITQYEHRQQALKIRLYEVKRILSLIIKNKNTLCEHKVCQAYYDSNAELRILLELIKSPLPTQWSDVEHYFSLLDTQKDLASNSIASNLFLKCSGLLYESKDNLDGSSSVSRSESFCICKYLRNRNKDLTQSFTFSPSTLKPTTKPENVSQEEFKSSKDLAERTGSGGREVDARSRIIKEKIKSEDETEAIRKKSSGKNKVHVEDDKENISINKRKVQKASKITDNKKVQSDDDNENVLINKRKDKESLKPTDTERKKHSSKQHAEYKSMMRLIKAQELKKKKAEEAAKKIKMSAISKIPELPEIKHVKEKVEIESQVSDSIIECDQEKSSELKFVYGNRIVPLHKFSKASADSKEHLIFKIIHEFLSAEKSMTTRTATPASEQTTTLKSKSHSSDNKSFHGYFKYALSDKKFIDNGWTQLPWTKVVRKMNIYKMVPAYPQFDWFANHRRQNLFYITGEKLAEIDEDGCGKWFYKNGRVALEFYKDIDAVARYNVYDCDDSIERKKSKSKTLASFDHLGNGIIYDQLGNPRLKYNQSEGLVIDKKLGPPGKWKWHTLNDPPILQRIYIDVEEKSDTCLRDVIKQQINSSYLMKRKNCDIMLAIELENYVKEKATKMLQTFKPFEIRVKTVKINDYFSVRISNQANIQLTYRCNQVSLKVNIGMLLVSTEIIDTAVSDVAEVSTPFDEPMARSKSVISI